MVVNALTKENGRVAIGKFVMQVCVRLGPLDTSARVVLVLRS